MELSEVYEKTDFPQLKNPIIFIGTGRSGTSVISEVVMRHKELAFPSSYQNRMPLNTKVNYLRRLLDNSLWRIHGQKEQLNKVSIINRYTFRPVEAYTMWNTITDDGVNFSRDFLLNKKASPEKVLFLRKYFKEMVKNQGRKRLSFKITGPSRMEYLLSIFPDANFVNLRREHVPVISSFIKVGFWGSRGMDKLWWQGAYSPEELEWANTHSDNPVALTALQIKKVIDCTEYEKEKMKPIYYEAHYKDFVQRPKEVVDGILSFLELSPDKACDSYLKQNKIVNRNKKDSEYFTNEELNMINSIFS